MLAAQHGIFFIYTNDAILNSGNLWIVCLLSFRPGRLLLVSYLHYQELASIMGAVGARWICAFQIAAPGSSPKHTIYALFNFYCSN